MRYFEKSRGVYNWLRPTSNRNMRRPLGFTLLECLIALAIMGFALAAILPRLGGELKSITEAERRVLASMHAQSLLDQISETSHKKPGHWRGNFSNGYAWRASLDTLEPGDQIEVPEIFKTTTLHQMLNLKIIIVWPGATDGLTASRLLIRAAR